MLKNIPLLMRKRHELLKKEMQKRKYITEKTINLNKFSKALINDWKPTGKDKKIIKKRLLWKIFNKIDYYRYYGQKRTRKFWKEMIENAI